MSAHKLL